MYSEQLIDELSNGVNALAAEWALSDAATVTLLEVSENATFRADDPARDSPLILRVHRPHYHTLAEIHSELAWIAALRRDQIVTTPKPIATVTGAALASFQHADDIRYVAAFEFMSGQPPDEAGNLITWFEQLGAISARLHAHSRTWTRAADFSRKIWNFDTTLGATPHWGHWRDALGLSDSGEQLLNRCVDVLQQKLADYGSGPDRFGLIHADLRIANLLVDAERLGVIDFDDCGFGWYLFDFAAAVSFIEDDPHLADLASAWIEGYRSVATLEPADAALLPTFVMLRRVQLTAWVASHIETPTGQACGAPFTEGTLALAERYLASGNLW